MTFTALGISDLTLKQLRDVDDAGRETAGYLDEEGGAPLRCCLRKSRPGERIALVSYAPLRRWAAERGVDPGAYVELGPVFIHEQECAGPAGPNELLAAKRVFRAYSADGRIAGGKLVEPGGADAAVREWFADERVALIHVRAVEFGCFMFEIRSVA